MLVETGTGGRERVADGLARAGGRRYGCSAYAHRAEWRANFGLPINTWIELEGQCGCGDVRDDGMLHEFGIDRAWTGDIGFEWKLEGGDIVIAGSRCGTGHMEADEWIARGAVPGRAVGR